MAPERKRQRSLEPDEAVHSRLEKLGAKPLTADDYFIKAAEFKAWLAQSRHKYLDEISSKEARRYFDKFVSRWNQAKLDDDYYLGKIRSAATPSSSHTRHKWNFASKGSYTHQEQQKLAMVRDSVDTMINSQTRGAREARTADKRFHGSRQMHQEAVEEPSTKLAGSSSGYVSRTSNASTSYAERQFDKEEEQEARTRHGSALRRKANQDARELTEQLAPRATGREAVVEKRRERNTANRDFANRKGIDDGLDMDEAVLMGGQDDLEEAKRAKLRGVERRGQGRQDRKAEKEADRKDRLETMRAKENETMAMLKQLAQQRFGSGNNGRGDI